jgi:hypothetical protein
MSLISRRSLAFDERGRDAEKLSENVFSERENVFFDETESVLR